MPYVNIQVTREGVTAEEKARLIKGATELLVDVLQKSPATTFVVIEESRWRAGVSGGCRSRNTGAQQAATA